MSRNSFCPQCGHVSDVNVGSPSVVYLTEVSVEPLIKLFRRELDDHPCEACAQPQGIQPTVAFRSVEPDVLHWIKGTLETGPQDFGDAATVSLPTLDDLRQLVATLLRDNLAPLLAVLSGINTPSEAVSARSFAALLVAVAVPTCGIETEVRRLDGTTIRDQQVLELAAAVQARCWTDIVRHWMTGRGRAATIEEDLLQHFAEGVVLPGADDQALASLDEIEARENMDVPLRYCLEATRASLCAAARRSNPKVNEWARAFLAVELNSRTLEPELVEASTPLLISTDRAHATIPFDEALQAMRPYAGEAFEALDEEDRNYLDALSDIAVKWGYPTLLSKIIGESGRLSGAENLSTDDTIAALRAAAVAATGQDLVSMATVLCRPLLTRGAFDELERVSTAVTDMMGGTPEARGRVDVWITSGLAQMGFPKKVIERIGADSRPWESELPFDVRHSLWNIRARALESLGRYYEALDQIDELLRIWPAEGGGRERREATRFSSELLRSTGAAALAVQRLEQLRGQTSGEEQLLVLQVLAGSYRMLSRYTEAVGCREQALSLASKTQDDLIPYAKAELALELTLAGRYEDAVRQLNELEDSFPTETAVLFIAALAWIIILGQVPSAQDSVQQLIARSHVAIVNVYNELANTAERAEQREAAGTLISALRLHNTLVHIMGLPDTTRIDGQWKILCEIRDRFSQPPSAVELLARADLAYAAGRIATGRHYLTQLPVALAAAVPGSSWGGVTGLGHLAAASQNLMMIVSPLLSRLTDTVVNRGSAPMGRTTSEDLRLLAEVRREALGRAQRVFRTSKASESWGLHDGLSDEVLAKLAPVSGRVSVVESLSYRKSAFFLVTVVEASGEVITRVAASPEPDLGGLAMRLRQRLSGWRLGRAGDPLDLPAWHALEIWLCRLLAEHLADGDHVVFIEPVEFSGLPWHVAVAGQWTASYTTSWTKLLSFVRAEAPPQPLSVGVARVPQFNESETILCAMRTSAERTSTLAATRRFPYVESVDRECDSVALAEMLSKVTTAKLLCHGFVSPAEQEVALMLAHAGALPLGINVSTDNQAARSHRFSWRDCRSLVRAPAVVFSAACSTGVSHVFGMGEPMGLFAGLTGAGTIAMVAPRWDVVAAAVLPILDAAFERYADGVPLAVAVHTACDHAAKITPRWLAWALALEGDWRCRSLSSNS